MEDLTKLKQYFVSCGMNNRAIERVLRKTSVRGVALIQRKIADYQTLLHIDAHTAVKMVVADPRILSLDTVSDSPTSVKSKIKDYQTILHVDERTVVKMIRLLSTLMCFDTTSNGPTSVKTKIKNYQTLLNTDERSVMKMIITHPSCLARDIYGDSPTSVKNRLKDYQTVLGTDEATVAKMFVNYSPLIGLDVNSDSPTSIANKVQYFQTAFQLDLPTLTQMFVKAPTLLALDTTSTGPKSLATKIQKMTEVIPLGQLRECVVYNPSLLTMPGQAFKIRYMLAENFDVKPRFLKVGYLTSQEKVWARANYLNRHPGIFNMNNIYISEKVFNQMFKVPSADLMQKYPLDAAAVAQIEQSYYIKTGHKLTLDQQERAAVGLER